MSHLILLLSTMTAAPSHVHTLGGTPEALWGFEIRLGSYKPKPANATVRDYNRLIYGSDDPLMISLEFDRYLIDFWGPLGVYATAGRWSADGKARVCDSASTTCDLADPSTVTATNSVPGNSTSSLTLYPLEVGIVYRFDLLRRLHVPLVPYAKAGINYFFWSASTDGETQTATIGGESVEGKGGSAGYSVAGGIALNLDWIDPSPARRSSTTFLASYFFAEFRKMWVDHFGEREVFDFSAEQYVFGVAFDFD